MIIRITIVARLPDENEKPGEKMLAGIMSDVKFVAGSKKMIATLMLEAFFFTEIIYLGN